MKTSDGKTYGDNAYENFGFSEVAPLVFPGLDNASNDNSEASNAFVQNYKGMQGFVGKYYDRRAMARYVSL